MTIRLRILHVFFNLANWLCTSSKLEIAPGSSFTLHCVLLFLLIVRTLMYTKYAPINMHIVCCGLSNCFHIIIDLPIHFMVAYWYGAISGFPQGQLNKPEGYGQTDLYQKHNKTQENRNRAHIILGMHCPLCLLTDGNCDNVESPGCGWIESKLFNLQQSSGQYDVSHTTAWRQTITWFNAQDLWLHIFPRR